jgi:hypothetical protein
LFKSFITGVVAAATFAAVAIVEVGTWGTATPLATIILSATWGQLAAAGAIAGAVGGGLGAGLEGGNILQGAFMGAAVGGLTGGITGGFSGAAARGIVGGVFAAAGAGIAYAQGGLEGLANFGAGLVGAYVGAWAMHAIGDPPIDQPNAATSGEMKTVDCTARVVKGRTDWLAKNKIGAFGRITEDTAAMEPAQFGLTKAGLRPYVGEISGSLEDGTPLFSGVSDRINASGFVKLQSLNPGRLIVEIPSLHSDLAVVDIKLTMPEGVRTPVGCR